MNRVFLATALFLCCAADSHARTVFRCVRDGPVSLSTAPEPGSQCTPKMLDDNAAAVPNLWGRLGVFQGTLYRREQDGRDRDDDRTFHVTSETFREQAVGEVRSRLDGERSRGAGGRSGFSAGSAVQ